MTIELWLAFTLAAAGPIMIPGPTVLLVVGFGFSAGARAAFLSMIGVALGDTAAITLSFLGVGALLALSAELFMGLKFAGALFCSISASGYGGQRWRRWGRSPCCRRRAA